MAGAPLGTVPDSGNDNPGRYAWFVFAVIAALGFVDWLVRQIVVGILPELKAQWQLSDSEIGLLAAMVPIMVSAAMLPLALVIDQWSRVKTIFLMAVLWSMATIACGFATTYGQLLAARAFIGLGEAAYGPAGFALLAWYFPLRLRSTVIGGALVAAALGNVLGIALGGTLAQSWGWQNTFIAAGVVSLIVSLFALTIKDYPTTPLASGGSAKGNVLYAMRALLRSPTVNLTYLGSASLLFVMSALVTWLPTYLGRFYGMSIAEASQLILQAGSLGEGRGPLGNAQSPRASLGPRHRGAWLRTCPCPCACSGRRGNIQAGAVDGGVLSDCGCNGAGQHRGDGCGRTGPQGICIRTCGTCAEPSGTCLGTDGRRLPGGYLRIGSGSARFARRCYNFVRVLHAGQPDLPT